MNGRIVLDGVASGAKTCLAEGIPLGIGNDVGCPFVTHYDFWRELCFFHKYVGASARETLHLATMGNARILGLDDYVGSVEQGKSADLIVVRDNPLDDLAVLRDVQMVMTRGRLIRDPHVRRMREIDQLLDRYM